MSTGEDMDILGFIGFRQRLPTPPGLSHHARLYPLTSSRIFQEQISPIPGQRPGGAWPLRVVMFRGRGCRGGAYLLVPEALGHGPREADFFYGILGPANQGCSANAIPTLPQVSCGI